MILHCVFCTFRADTSHDTRHAILSDLERFSLTLDGVLDFDFGPNRDFEGKSPKVTDGFVIRFKDRDALDAYAVHPTHKQLGSRLCGLCDGGAGGIMVVDLDCEG